MLHLHIRQVGVIQLKVKAAKDSCYCYVELGLSEATGEKNINAFNYHREYREEQTYLMPKHIRDPLPNGTK